MRGFIGRAIAAALLCGTVLAVSPGAAVADDRGPVPNHAIVGSVDLFNMTEAEARASIAEAASVSDLPPLQVTAAGRSFSLEPWRCLVLDVDAMIAAVYAPSSETTFTVERSCIVSATPVKAFVATVATSVKRSSRNASYYVKAGRLKWRAAIVGRSLYTDAAVTAITQALADEAASGTARPTLALAYKSYAPAVTNAKLGRAILVDLSQRRLWLYDHSRLVRTFRVAVGMRGYSTPRGTFKITAKRKNPSWRNPGSAWAKGMPAYIAPSPRNPLGTRALYVSAPGIRIHGTSQTWSIGRAASHGCIRLTNRNVEKLFPLVPVGTKVFIVQ